MVNFSCFGDSVDLCIDYGLQDSISNVKLIKVALRMKIQVNLYDPASRINVLNSKWVKIPNI